MPRQLEVGDNLGCVIVAVVAIIAFALILIVAATR